MKQFVLYLFTLYSISAFAQDINAISDPKAVKRNLAGSFAAISVSDGIDLFLTQGSEESVAVSASDEKYLDQFKTVLENGLLKIYYDSKGINLGINGKKKLKAYVSFKALEKLTASSGSDVFVKDKVEVNNLAMKFNSGTHFEGKLNAKEITVEQNSGSGISISGRSDKIKVECHSGSIFKGYGLAVDYCDAKTSSGAGVRITVNKELVAKASSGSAIRYKGDGLIRDINTNSGGTVKKEK